VVRDRGGGGPWFARLRLGIGGQMRYGLARWFTTDWPGGSLAAEQVAQRALEIRLAELVPGPDQPLRAHVLAGLGDFPGSFRPEQQPRPEPGDREDRGPVQDRGQRPGVVLVPRRLRGDRVDRPRHARLEDPPP